MNSSLQIWMRHALMLAKQRRGFCAPNPAVGALLVRHGRIIGEGYHEAAGAPHAEVNAIHAAIECVRGATLFVTLEPCCHHGKTSPCTDLLIQHGIKNVFYAFADPNPAVAGKGAAQLAAAGIPCNHLPLAEIDTFYQSYHYWQQAKKPWVTIKLAMSADGKIAGEKGAPVPITGAACQRLTHEGRYHADAILTTLQTVLQDDPQLNVRLDDQIYAKPIFLLDSWLQLPLTAKVLTTSSKLTVFHRADADLAKRQMLLANNVTCVAVDHHAQGLDIHQVLTYLGEEGLHDVWVEAGARCFKHFVTERFANKVILYTSPHSLGETALPVCSETLQTLMPKEWLSYGEDQVAEVLLLQEKTKQGS